MSICWPVGPKFECRYILMNSYTSLLTITIISVEVDHTAHSKNVEGYNDAVH